jgi:8-oxo-dGTP pyrophosphatase MutT (NUDIX family)
MTPNKVCPVVLRQGSSAREVLAFQHPLAGRQLVKGSIEDGEAIEAAAMRELSEETGIREARVVRHLGPWASGFQGQVWAFVLCEPRVALVDSWVHHVEDDGGHDFQFFWQPLFEPVNDQEWHPLFQNALAFIRTAI